MFRYRSRSRSGEVGAGALADVRQVIAEVLQPAHFYVAPDLTLEWQHLPTEETPWELFQGRLLDRAHTRQQRSFEAWNVNVMEGTARSGEPLLALKLDATRGELHVTRGLLCHVWEGYHAGDNVYLSRETTRWVRELVGTITLAHFADFDDLLDEIAGRLFQAVVGLSRLPLTSVEAPLPAFTLGQLAYFHRPQPLRVQQGQTEAGPMRSWRELTEGALHRELSYQERVKVLEALLRTVPAEDLRAATNLFVERWQWVGHGQEMLPGLLRALFNEVSLSPWTDFTAKALRFVECLVERGNLTVAQQADFLGYLLRQLARHLTAYDLVTFHHRGANYPDALLLDEVLKAYLHLIEREPELFATADEGGTEAAWRRLLRRALRQGWLLRRHYQGHLVPDAPTSPGENARVLPPPHQRVPEEQIALPGKRTRRLYADDPLPAHLGEQGRRVLRQCVQDLCHPEELRELGMAVFIDRPLGVFKAPTEPDQTGLLSYEAWSRSIALRRLRQLAGDDNVGLDSTAATQYRKALEDLAIPGLSLDAVGHETRPVVSLTDACKAADDFVLLRTLPAGLKEFLRQYDDLDFLRGFFDLKYPNVVEPVLIVRGRSAAGALLAIYDARLRLRMELEINGRAGYASRGGVEFPRGRLRILRLWEPDPASGTLLEKDVSGEELFLGRLLA
jgi:hypothetical protein